MKYKNQVSHTIKAPAALKNKIISRVLMLIAAYADQVEVHSSTDYTTIAYRFPSASACVI